MTRRGSSGSNAKSASSLQIAKKHQAVSAAFTAVELGCDSNEELPSREEVLGLARV